MTILLLIQIAIDKMDLMKAHQIETRAPAPRRVDVRCVVMVMSKLVKIAMMATRSTPMGASVIAQAPFVETVMSMWDKSPAMMVIATIAMTA